MAGQPQQLTLPAARRSRPPAVRAAGAAARRYLTALLALGWAERAAAASTGNGPPRGNKTGLFTPLDGGINRGCRGANFTDNSPDNFVLHKGVATLGECMRLCISSPVCKGIEFSEIYNDGQCEVWTRAEGISATAPVHDFMCLRYGSAAEKFDLIGGASSNRVCRGDTPDDNSEAYYTLHKNVSSLNDCKDLCVSTPKCKGIEYNQRLDGGRCEVWTRTAGIGATLPQSGFLCLRYGMQENFEPKDGGSNRLCRGASPVDNSPDYYVVHNETASLDACKKLCMEAPVCKGIEYNQMLEGGRCEVWTRTAGISATAPGRGFTCLQYGTIAEQFALADGGENRACRGASPDDNSPLYFVLHLNTSTLSACKELCINAPICRGIEYSPRYDGGRCEVWTRGGGIGATQPMVGSVCLRYGSSAEKFEPVDGGADRVCRGGRPGDDSPSYYELFMQVDSLSECKTICVNAPVCRGIEYIAERGRCEVWTRADGITASMPVNGSTCLRYGASAQFDMMDGGVDRACRGSSATDDSPSYYVLHTETASLAECQALCLGTPGCKGIEFSDDFDSGRCEVWTRSEGIIASAPLKGTTCLTYGHPVVQFNPVDGGTNRVCRGANADDNATSNFALHTGTPSLGACKALCIDAPVCWGIEYTAAYDEGRCEIWTRKGGILATRPSRGSTCLSYGTIHGQFEPLDGGIDRVCRGASPRDDAASYYALHTHTPSLDECKRLCLEAPVCKGIEHHPGHNGGRCEVWTRMGGIRATAPGDSSTCYRYGTSEPFTPVDGGEGRACRGSRPSDRSPSYYVLYKGVASLDDCKRLCISAALCKGIEYSREYDSGRCEVWIRPGGIGATTALAGTQCLRFGKAELFLPVDGGVDRACRGARETDDSPAYYTLHHDTPSIGACESLCVDTPLCRGIEYSEGYDGGRCEVWTRVGGILATRPSNGTSCLQYGEPPMDSTEARLVQRHGAELAGARGAAGATAARRRRRAPGSWGWGAVAA